MLSAGGLCVLAAIAWLSPGRSHASLPHKIEEADWESLRHLYGVPTTPRQRRATLYVFFDPNCPYCARLWEAFAPGGALSDVPSVWIPVPYMNASSHGRAAALLRDPLPHGLQFNFGQFDHGTRQGGIQPVKPNERETRAAQEALAVWVRLGGGTPLLVWRHKDGDIPVKFVGLPRAGRVEDLILPSIRR